MRLSIVTPSYNQGPYIERTIQSVLDQAYPDLEYWVMDGGSTDSTVEILRRYEDRLQWISEKDKGQGDAVNKGFQRATGDILGWLNSDDTYTPEAFRTVMEYFEAHPEINFVCGACQMIDEEDRVLYVKQDCAFNLRRLVRMGVSNVVQPTVFFRRELLEKAGAVDISYRHGMDYELWCRMGPHIRAHYFTQPLANWRYQADSKTCSQRHISIEEGKLIRSRYLQSKWELPWCWYYDFRVKLYLVLEPYLFRWKPEKNPAGRLPDSELVSEEASSRAGTRN
ncbi:MAG: glycosyltransferase [Armatimonadetes bacterium]|nr:glycosyltransferase [Armatimonadota bacterium]